MDAIKLIEQVIEQYYEEMGDLCFEAEQVTLADGTDTFADPEDAERFETLESEIDDLHEMKSKLKRLEAGVRI